MPSRPRLMWIGAGSIAVAAAAAILLLVVAPAASTFFAGLDTGVTLRQAAIAGLIVSFLLIVVFAVAAGDGLLGEIQYMIVGFFAFFVFFTLFVAWVF